MNTMLRLTESIAELMTKNLKIKAKLLAALDKLSTLGNRRIQLTHN